MKILILSEFIENYKDVASFEIRYLTALKIAERGHDVVFMSPSNRNLNATKRIINKRFKTITTPGIFPDRLRTGGFSTLDAFFKTMIVLKNHFDVIQVTTGHRPAQLIPCMVGKYLQKSIIVDECWEWFGKGGFADKRKGIKGKIISLYDKYSELKFKRIFDHIITISTTLRNRFENKQNITVLHGGTLNNSLKDYEIVEARKELNIDLRKFIIGMSNVLPSDHEDNTIFFKAFERLCHDNPNISLLITSSDKYYINQLKTEYSFLDNLIYPGWVEFNVYNKYLSSCNLFVLPFSNTPINAARWPNKIGDYLCLNRPVVTNPTGDVKLLFDQYKVGILCDQTSEGFFRVINDILNKSIKLESYTKDSLYVAHEILSFDKRIDKYLEIFEKEVKKDSVSSLVKVSLLELNQ
jgi:glycosyltransferase involved in cell wall biosynthesis